MPLLMPTPVMRNAVALATAAQGVDNPGGREKLTELVAAMTGLELSTTALCLARILGTWHTAECLQILALECLQDGIVGI